METKSLTPKQKAYFSGWLAADQDQSTILTTVNLTKVADIYFLCRGALDRINKTLMTEDNILKLEEELDYTAKLRAGNTPRIVFDGPKKEIPEKRTCY